VSQLSERMLDQLQHYVDTTVCDYDEFTSYRAQLNYPFTSPTPAASEIHENILRTMRPQLARTIQAPDEEELALKLTDHDSVGVYFSVVSVVLVSSSLIIELDVLVSIARERGDA